MVTPSNILCVLSNLLGGINILARKDLIDGDELALERVTSEVNSLGEGSKVLVVVANTSVEVVVNNVRHVKRVGRCELDGTSVVAGVSLEDGPGEPVVLGSGIVSVVGEVTTEVDGATESKDVVLVTLGCAGLVEHGCAKTGGSVDTTVAQDAGLPAVHAGVRLAVTECAAVECGEVGGGFALDVDLVVVLEVGSDTGEVDNDGDVELGELIGRADTTQLEELRGVVGSTCDDDFLGGSGGTSLTLGTVGLGAGLVEVLAVEELDTGSAGRSDVLVKGDLGHVAVHPDIERVLLAAVVGLCVTDSEDKLAGSATLAIGGRERDLVESGLLVTALGVGVGITGDQGTKVDNGVGSVAESESGTTDQAEKLGVRGDDIDGGVVGS